jgi:hypothetical protein
VFHADGQTDMTKLIVVFRNYSNEPKKIRYLCVLLCSVGFGGLVVPLHIACVCECGIYVYVQRVLRRCATSRMIPGSIPGGVT